jgi:hypothetical protein
MKRPAWIAPLLALLLVAPLLLVACAASAPQAVEKVVQQAVEAPAEAEPAAEAFEAEAPAAEAPSAEAPAQPEPQSGLAGLADLPSPYQEGRKIIKNGDMALLVADTDAAIDNITLIAVGQGGYIVSSESEERDGAKYATMRLGVPVDRFEETQRRLRALAIKVLRDNATGEDVTDQYVDLQSQLNNLEATAARVRTFLDETKTVEEALDVNTELTRIEGEIEQVKGRMNYLKDRAAFSTLLVSLEPQLPTPTPTPTATPTPTPTPIAFKPVDTAKDSFITLGNLTKGLATGLIQFTIVLGPFLVPVFLLIWWLARRRRRHQQPVVREAPVVPSDVTPAATQE